MPEERTILTAAQRLLRAERVLVGIRWLIVPWGILQILLYGTQPYPDGTRAAAVAVIAALIVGNGLVWASLRLVRSDAGASAVAVAGTALEVAVASAMVWVYAFDSVSALWAVLFLVPAAAAMRFQLLGAIGAWAVTAALYVGRELWASAQYGLPLLADSISFRLGLLLLMAIVVGMLSRTLVREREQLQHIEQWRTRMVSMLAHDVRSPLAAISTCLQMLEHPGLTDDQRNEFLAGGRRKVTQLLSLAEDLLTMAANDDDAIVLRTEHIAVTDAVREAVDTLDAYDSVTVDAPVTLSVQADPRRLHQVLVNLIGNALHHGRPPVVVSGVRIYDRVQITVADAGDGVLDEVVPGLFEPFNHSRGAASTGLGLWIVRLIVEAHGGSVAYQPRDRGGSCFHVLLPDHSPLTDHLTVSQQQQQHH